MAGLVPATHDLRVAEHGAAPPQTFLRHLVFMVAGTSPAMTISGRVIESPT